MNNDIQALMNGLDEAGQRRVQEILDEDRALREQFKKPVAYTAREAVLLGSQGSISQMDSVAGAVST